MRLPHVRITVKRLMLGIVVVATILAGAIEFTGMRAKRKECELRAANHRRCESTIRDLHRRFQLCKDRHGPWADCRQCASVWWGACLSDHIVTYHEAIQAYQYAEEHFRRRAERDERRARSLWGSLTPSAAEVAEWKAYNDYEPFSHQFMRSY